MPKTDVTIFNASADEPSGTDLTVKLTGARVVAGANAVSADQPSANDAVVELTGASMSAEAGAISGTPDYPQTYNTWGGSYIAAISDIFDPTSPAFLFARVAGLVLLQTIGLVGTGAASRVADYQQLHSDNPLFFGALHMTHWGDYPAYRKKNTLLDHHFYNYLNENPYRDTLLHIDVDNVGTSLALCESPASSFGGTGCFPNCVHIGNREYVANLAHDILTGGNKTGDSPGGGDLADFIGWFNDSTPLRQPKQNTELLHPMTNGNGAVVSILDNVGTHIRQVRIDTQPGATCVGEEIVFFNPSGTGFIGYRISAYSETGGQAIITLSPLPNNAGTQTSVPVAGWKYTICDSNNATQSADWNNDGTPTNEVVSATQWTPGWLDYWDRIDEKILETKAHKSSRGWNGIGQSFRDKEKQGWTVPHEFKNAADYCTCENASITGGFLLSSTSHDYRIQGSTPDKMMRLVNYIASFTKTPNEFMRGKARGSGLEIGIWGTDSTATYSTLDAAVARFWLAAARTVEGISVSATLLSSESGNDPVMIEEFWLDFDTNYSTPSPVCTYSEDSGTSGSRGPFHSVSFAAADWGERGYFRRLGNFLMAINLADWPTDYGVFYQPAVGALRGTNTARAYGWVPRDTNDEITSTDFAQLYTDGVLSGGETLRHVDFSTYVNSSVTSYLRTENPSHWSAYSYGPQQPHPDDSDGTYTLATHPWIARDPDLNDGSTVNQASSYYLGPMEAIFWEIV